MTTPAPPTATLAAWLKQQVAAEEALATAATAGPWEFENAGNGFSPMVIGDGMVVADTFDKPHLADAAHIAAQDPAQTLRRVAVIRQVLALHEIEVRRVWMNPFDSPAYQEDEFSCSICGWFETGAGCDTLRALAAQYADRDGYRAEEWA